MADGPSDFGNETWIYGGDGSEWCAENPTVDQCWDYHVPSHYHYDINLAANVALAVIFALSLVGFVVVWASTRRATAFCVTLSLGVICEIFGYIGRIMSYDNPWDDPGFMIQICCLTIGPAFMAAGLYLCLRRIVIAYGQENSRIKASHYTLIFVPCDFVALVLQAVGGVIAAISEDPEDAQMGVDIMVAGLAVQVATSVGFITAYAFFVLRCRKRYRLLGDDAYEQDPAIAGLRNSIKFKLFRVAHIISTLCILWRSCFRLAEMAGGQGNWLQQRQDLFIGMEGGLIVVAVLLLNFFHPAFCLKQVFMLPKPPSNRGGLFGMFRKKQPVVFKEEMEEI
ncbi:hypothetical protein S7711_00685 [Stachybotrys chartarum IBT 7711]|uniref:Sphingoid long-chain base transporter RSB1 n=1 Tax=Stachybotrys chartarum (strain CBS 109288 / IBT 7711) TaxID=1280523 RepID=A0A084AU38_STACB|nr:hypothetical protein S7711_00685 [Stachybotrys chartarum IBT 7711]KFA47846.1 hypothetical protein S40293_06420 [Stachybotrys chartarum IBT 40293]KFA80985.1 hypothetical protein S40288_00765 [Stachybotrys chartarum IBT 40288]